MSAPANPHPPQIVAAGAYTDGAANRPSTHTLEEVIDGLGTSL